MAFGRAGDGRDLLQSRREMSAASGGSSNLALVYESLASTAIVHTSHFIPPPRAHVC